MKIFMILPLLLLMSCEQNMVFIRGDTIVEKQEFEGKYTFDNQSFIELITSVDNEITFVTAGQSLNSVNPENDTVGTHPIISDRDVELTNGKLVLPPRNVNYNTRHDIEQDISGSNITGSHRTDVTVEKTANNGIKITIMIWQGALNNNINTIIATRILTSD